MRTPRDVPDAADSLYTPTVYDVDVTLSDHHRLLPVRWLSRLFTWWVQDTTTGMAVSVAAALRPGATSRVALSCRLRSATVVVAGPRPPDGVVTSGFPPARATVATFFPEMLADGDVVKLGRVMWLP